MALAGQFTSVQCCQSPLPADGLPFWLPELVLSGWICVDEWMVTQRMPTPPSYRPFQFAYGTIRTVPGMESL